MHTYHLEKYQGRATRHECPNCHDAHSFTFYIDERGDVLNEDVGMCNHVSSCGYHYTPKQYFSDNPDATERYTVGNKHEERPRIYTNTRQPDCIPNKYMIEAAKRTSNLLTYLSKYFDDVALRDMIKRYYLGGARDGSTIYWQIDTRGMVRGGKLINYNPDTGHRCKEVAHPVTWVHSILKSKGLLPDSWQLSQCLFGAHLLADPKNDNKAVGIVEAEKTACICSLIMPTYIWMACGGLEQLKSNNKLSILKDHAIILYPDIDGYEKWREEAKELNANGYNIKVSETLEKVATEADRAAKVDIADITMRYIVQKPGRKQDTTTAQEIKPLKILSQPTCNDSKTKTPRDINVTIARKTQPKERGRCLECGNAYLMGDGDNPIICMCKAMKNERFVASTSRLCKLYKSVEALPLPLHDMILCKRH
jgi:hypothetical protein